MTLLSLAVGVVFGITFAKFDVLRMGVSNGETLEGECTYRIPEIRVGERHETEMTAVGLLMLVEDALKRIGGQLDDNESTR